MAFIEDSSIFLDLDGFGVSVTAGAISGSGIKDENSELPLGGDVAMIDYMLTILSSQFGNLQYGDLITVDGDVYKVEHKPMPFDDGMFSKIPLMLLPAVLNVFELDVFEAGVFV